MGVYPGRTGRDSNRVPATYGVSSADGLTVLPIEVNPVTGGLITDTTISGISLPAGASTATNQLNEIDILNLIQSAVQSIAGTKGISADLRVTILSGTVTTVTTVNTLSNITSIGGYNATGFMMGQNNMAAIQSNINNIVR